MLSDKEFSDLLRSHEGRISIVDISHNMDLDNFQRNKTPMSIIRKMCDKTSVFDKEILVLFNLEFLEHLVFERKIPVGNITFIADTKLEQTICKSLYGVYSIVIPEKEFKNGNFIKEIKDMGKQFDLCFSNPPYNANVDLKIIRALEPICDEMVVVHPSTWLIDLKGKSKRYNSFKSQLEGKVKSVELFNGNPVFNIGLFVPCVITHINGDNGGEVEVNNFGEKFVVSSLDDVTKFGKDWETIVKPFFEQMKKYCSENGSILDHNVFEIEEGKHYVQLAAIRGTPYRGNDCDAEILLDDFYTMVMKDSEGNKGIRNSKVRKDGLLVWEFSSARVQDNFINYLKTYFSRFCLSLYKISQNNHYGELSLIPWLDFTQEWDDEKLFKYFNIDKQTQNYIREFIPDFHGVRK